MTPTIRPQSVLKGAGSFLLPFLRTTHAEGGTIDAEYCYNLFLRHYSYVRRFTDGSMPRIVAELGPGSSLGTGLAALLAGAEQYIALDLEEHRSSERDLNILDQLSDLFRERTDPIAGPFPPPANYKFPPELVSGLAKNLAPDRLQRIRANLAEQRGDLIRYVAPWTDSSCITPSTIDWLFSHAVFEHIDDLAGTYASIECWLRPGGLTTHLIDFYSHRLTAEWNGHWAIGDRLWRVIRGRRPYLINRVWRTQHLDFLRKQGFTTLEEITAKRDDGLHIEQFVSPFRAMPEEDARTQMMFVVARKNGVT